MPLGETSGGAGRAEARLVPVSAVSEGGTGLGTPGFVYSGLPLATVQFSDITRWQLHGLCLRPAHDGLSLEPTSVALPRAPCLRAPEHFLLLDPSPTRYRSSGVRNSSALFFTM